VACRIDLKAYEALDQSIVATVLPVTPRPSA
jgi:hypothetical protein